ALGVAWGCRRRRAREGTALLGLAGNPGLAREVDGRTLANPLRAASEDAVGHEVHELVAEGALEHAALAQRRQRQQMQLAVDERRRGEPGAAGRELVGVGGGMEPERDAGRRLDAQRPRELVARLQCLTLDRRPLALVAVREP